MVMRVQVVEGEYRVVLPPEAVEELKLREGAPVEITPIKELEVQHRYMTREEGMAAYRSTLEEYRGAYEELAK